MAPSSGSVRIIVDVDSDNVEQMLARTTLALSTVGMIGFLSGVVGPWLKERAEDRFAAEGDDVSNKWVPLEGYTQQVRAAGGYGAAHPINRRTGELENYITQNGSDVMSAAGFSQLTFPGSAPTAREATKVMTAQMGATYPATPARPVLGVNEVDLAFVLAALATHVTLAQTIPVRLP
ncbi:hypothetical protein AB0F25_30505 [Streptomyces wedmorensis]|uniref:hypothetical protein n=1 Tax=Streptomyces wedmorensis TaxID=43759 RepID=UPI0034215B38